MAEYGRAAEAPPGQGGRPEQRPSVRPSQALADERGGEIWCAWHTAQLWQSWPGQQRRTEGACAIANAGQGLRPQLGRAAWLSV